ncbi:MAG: LysR family transcriptional regulator [Pelagimonas sp.]|jgi:DNA-binding transcriptional LysR family regulator|nr:LysR family transcriptional regulator [Pelagimonas sp.]
MLKKGVTLKGLEVFEALAMSGSVAGAAEQTGMSQPSVSQQMRNLEKALGVDLVDHGRRPMQLTPAGRNFLTRTKTVLGQLRQAQSELTVMDLTDVSALDLGVIDDFDNDLTPRLVSILAESMRHCRFRLTTSPSHQITDALKSRRLHLAISGSHGEGVEGVVEYPLVRDPFIFVCPKGGVDRQGGIEAVMQATPLLRHDRDLMIGRQVETHLRRLKLHFPERFEIGAHLSLMTLVSRGAGWTLTTSTGFMRAARLHDQLEAHPLPFEPFARRISLFATNDWTSDVPRDMARTSRLLMQEMVVEPALHALPWLQGDLELLDAP